MLVARFGEKLDSSRALHTPFASRCFVGGIPPPRLVRAWWRITRTRVSPFPCACSSHASPCPDLPLWRVFLRSFCARRRPVSELTFVRRKEHKIQHAKCGFWYNYYELGQSPCGLSLKGPRSSHEIRIKAQNLLSSEVPCTKEDRRRHGNFAGGADERSLDMQDFSGRYE